MIDITKPVLTDEHKDVQQIFSVFTEQEWQLKKTEFGGQTAKFFSGKKGEFFVLTGDYQVNYLIGLGNEDSVQGFEVQNTATKFAFSYRQNFESVPTAIICDFNDEKLLREFVKGLFLGTYKYPFKNDHAFWQQGFELVHPSFSEQTAGAISAEILALCKGQFTCMDWLNKPANFKKTPEVSAFLKKISNDYHLKYTAYNRAECEKLGLNAFVSVNLGSAEDCAFTVLEYSCGNSHAKTVGLIGKCVLFDTGGISLKNPENMHYMKSDMGGATAVIGTLIAACEQKIPVNIVAILPVTDNAISASATLPSDVVTAYNGKTIEVLNTDAEGRMTLADALSYLGKNYKTDAMIDLATLTGSSVRMFGDTCGAMFSNNENLKNQLTKSGDETNQRVWNLPLWDIWKDDFKSEVADFRNISLKPIGDCIVAAKFLEQFIENHKNWAHLDIAGVAFGNVCYSKEKASTGYGVQLLLNFLEDFSA